MFLLEGRVVPLKTSTKPTSASLATSNGAQKRSREEEENDDDVNNHGVVLKKSHTQQSVNDDEESDEGNFPKTFACLYLLTPLFFNISC